MRDGQVVGGVGGKAGLWGDYTRGGQGNTYVRTRVNTVAARMREGEYEWLSER